MNKKEVIHSFFQHRVGMLATMHHKETVMAPLLEKELGIHLKVPANINTDCFGTFTRDIERTGNQLEAAKAKVENALLLTGESLAFSSEGSFGPHPYFPFVSFNREIVFMADKENELEIFAEAVTTDTNFNHKEIKSIQEAAQFCQSVGFPEHAVVVKASAFAKQQNEIIKGITTKEHLIEAVEYMLKRSPSGEIFIETDMRAFCNPTRMKNIEAATNNLINKIYNICPDCLFPGFELIERKKGLRCSWCGLPTELIFAEVYSCKKCGASEEKSYGKGNADPSQCSHCNP